MIVYTVTVVDVVSDPVLGSRRTPAVFTTMEQAVATVRNNEGDLTDNNLYQYAVIEETYLNMVRPDTVHSTRMLWFKYNTAAQEFEVCPVENLPGSLSRLSGFGIG